MGVEEKIEPIKKKKNWDRNLNRFMFQMLSGDKIKEKHTLQFRFGVSWFDILLFLIP